MKALLLLVGISLAAFGDVLVKIDTGLLTGKVLPSGVRVFKGIPYAAPPIGKLRWRSPQPVKPWTSPRPATAFGAACFQAKYHAGASEDCLTLNIWTPENAQKLPVMFWIHGGAFFGGASSLPYYDGESLAKKQVILVSINYRLGGLGFYPHPGLKLESSVYSAGNYGLEDQIYALKWVARNIAAFGGDPTKVTIFGESAGGQSVGALLASPYARGLFRAAIMESGFGAGMAATLKNREVAGLKAAHYFDCIAQKDLTCMRALPLEQIAKFWEPSVLKETGLNYFAPLVDGSYLPLDPVAAYSQGKQAKVPVLVGTNKNEGANNAKIMGIKTQGDYKALLISIFSTNAGKVFAMFPTASDADVTSAVDKLFTVMSMFRWERRLARDLTKQNLPVYAYQFTRVPPGASGVGAYHALEIPYVFGNLGNDLMFDEQDQELSEKMQTYWTNFAKNLNPNGDGLPQWPMFKASSDEPHLELGDEIRPIGALWQKEADLLDSLMNQ